MTIDKTGSTENIDSYKRVREPLSPQVKTDLEMNRFFMSFFNVFFKLKNDNFKPY